MGRESLAVAWRRITERHPELRALIPEEPSESDLLDAVERVFLRHRPVSVGEMFGQPIRHLPEPPGGWRPRWCLACVGKADGTRPMWPCPPLRALTGMLHATVC